MKTEPSSAYSRPLPESQATVVRRRFARRDGRATGEEQAEAARAIGHLHGARLQAGLSEERRLLIAEHAAHGDLRAEELRRGDAEIGGGGDDLRQDRGGDFQG